MKKGLAIFLFSYYLLGAMMLPMGELSALKDLPEMYRHCRATEDADLDVIEFLTEHVFPVGQLMEGIEHDDPDEDGDKPHAPITIHVQQQISCIVYHIKTTMSKPVSAEQPALSQYVTQDYSFSHIAFVFRPPVAA